MADKQPVICNALVCGSIHDVIAVAVAFVIAAVIRAYLIWVCETSRGGMRRD